MEERYKILITDDDPDLRELLTEVVKNRGYDVGVARDGAEALKKLRMEKYHIVITDLMMPGMDGLELLRNIKELDREILVIIITGYATLETAVKAIELGAYDYIAKPFRLEELMIVIKNACERLRLMAQNSALLNELRNAYSEIAMLKNALSNVYSEEPKKEGDSKEPETDKERKEEKIKLSKQHGYLTEAERFVNKKKSFAEV